MDLVLIDCVWCGKEFEVVEGTGYYFERRCASCFIDQLAKESKCSNPLHITTTVPCIICAQLEKGG